jgi:hypothetical protein
VTPLAAASALTPAGTASATEASSAGASATDAGTSTQTADYDSQAFALAASSGRRVEVLERREESAEFFANPDGSLTKRQYSTPEWSKLDGTWRKADPTLVVRGDGTIAPAAPVFGITFSGGGSTPLATMNKDGKQLSLTWPAPLPAPVLDADTAVYPSVLPDVDLKVIAQVDGFAEQLIVKSASAAADPAVKTITLGVSTQGVTLDDDGADNLLAKAPDGTVVFSAPRPKMWEAPQQSAPAAQKARTAAEATDEPSASAPVTADVSGDTLTLTPDPTALATADSFPLIIDPPFTGGQVEKWAVVYSAYPTEDYPNGSGWHSDNPADEPRVGYNGSGATRSFFAMNTNGLEGATVSDASFALVETHSWGCDPDAAGPTELWSAGSITTTPTWNTSTALLASKLDSKAFAHGNPTYCPGNKDVSFASTELTNYVRQAADNSWGTLVLALKAASGYEYDQDSYKRFTGKPALEVTFNYPPTISTSAAYEGVWNPSGEGNKKIACGGVIGNSGLALTAKVADKDGGKVTAEFSVTNTTTGAAVSFPSHPQVSSGSTASATVPVGTNTPSGSYTWKVRAVDDENTTSSYTTPCAFTIDRQGPGTVTVTTTNSDGNDVDPTTVTTKARTSLQLKLSNTATDLAGFCYTLDEPVSVAGTVCSNGTWVASDSSGKATITVTPTGWPASTLYLTAYDKAGNHSPYDGDDGNAGDTIALATFKSSFVYGPDTTPDSLVTKDLHGDLNGDGYRDFVATEATGKLRFYAGDGTGKVSPSVEVGVAGWSGALIAHGGDFTGFTKQGEAPDGYEDFLVRLADNKLYLYGGNGEGSPIHYTRTELANPVDDDWSPLLQLITPGDIDDNLGDDLIAIYCVQKAADSTCANAQLRLYSGRTTTGDGTADQDEPFDFGHPTVIGSGGWQDLTNLAVGDLNGDHVSDIVARDPDSQQLYLYPGQKTANGYALGTRTPSPYGNAGWSAQNRPLLTSPGNVQGTVVNATIDEDGTPVAYRQFQPTPGEEYGDFWATTPASTTATVTYQDDTGASQTTTCPTGCLLFYPGGPTTHRAPHLVGNGAWNTTITGIY